MLLAAIEAGGTKFVCGVGNAETGSLETTSIPTRDPDSTDEAAAAVSPHPLEDAGLLAGYVAALPDMAAVEGRILPPLCQEPSGLIGSYILAANAVAGD